MNILVVDDEMDMQALFEQRFRKEIRNDLVHFAFATSGEMALQYLEGHWQEAVLILSDINMPGMSGLELLQHIKHDHEPPTPMVIMITAYGDEENYKQAMNLGADDFLTKPIDFQVLKAKLKLRNED